MDNLKKLVNSDDRTNYGQLAAQSIVALTQWEAAKTVCLFVSRRDEIDMKFLLAEALNAHKTAVLPRVEKSGLVLHRISSIKDLVRGAYEILEPKKSCQIIRAAVVDLFIVPGIAFDRSGNRIGRGKGYYDKLLVGTNAPKIGLAYSFQVLAEVPHTSYDVPMTMIVTEREVMNSWSEKFYCERQRI